MRRDICVSCMSCIWIGDMYMHRMYIYPIGRGNDLVVESTSGNPEGRGLIPCLGSRRSSLISIEHAELLRSTPSLVLCCAWLVTMALHVHCGLSQLSPLPTSGDDEWVAAKHCGRAKRSRINDTHRLRSRLQLLYINNQSLLFLLYMKREHLYVPNSYSWNACHAVTHRATPHMLRDMLIMRRMHAQFLRTSPYVAKHMHITYHASHAWVRSLPHAIMHGSK